MAKAWRNLEATVVAGIDYAAIRARGSNVSFYKLEKKHFISEMIRMIFANSEKYNITVHVEQANVAEIQMIRE